MSVDTLTTDSLLERIRREGVRRTANALRKPPIPSRLLQELASFTDAPEAREFVAAYALSPSHLLEALAAGSPTSAVLAHLATNPRTPPHLVCQLAGHPDASVRSQAAAHPQLPARELLLLANDPDTGVRRALAANPSLRLPHHAALVADTDPAVRLNLVSQAALPAAVALVLAADPCAVVRLHAAATATADDDLLQGWACSDEEDVQLALLQRKNLPVEIRHTLLRSPHASVRREVRDTLEPDDVDLLFVATHGEPDERVWVAVHPGLSRPLQSVLARDSAPGVTTALAANPSLDESIVRYFMGLADAPVCEALAGNPSVSPEFVQELSATRFPGVLTALAYRDDLDAKLAHFLVVHSPEFRRHWAIQGRSGVELDAATAKTLLADPLPTIRVLAVSAFSGWRRADLYDIARDPAPVVRIAALRHANAADEMLDDWRADPAPEVAAVANEVREARAQRRPKLPPMPPVVLSATPRKTTVDAPPVRPTLDDSRNAVPSFTTADTSHADAPAPDLLNKLKRIFWQ